MVPDDAMPPSTVDIDWVASDGSEHSAVIDLIREIFPGRAVHHNVPKEDVNEDWARHDKVHPDILVEVNDRTITVYMKARILTRSSAAGRPDIQSRKDLVSVWSHTY
nr:hypothetical protein [Lysobacter enzymogenes]